MCRYENPTLNAKIGETVIKSDGRKAEIITSMKIAIVRVDGKLEINSSLQNSGKKWNPEDKRQKQLVELWEQIHDIFNS